MTPSMLQHLAPYLEQSGEVIRFEGLNGVVRMSADAPDAPGYARTWRRSHAAATLQCLQDLCLHRSPTTSLNDKA